MYYTSKTFLFKYQPLHGEFVYNCISFMMHTFPDAINEMHIIIHLSNTTYFYYCLRGKFNQAMEINYNIIQTKVITNIMYHTIKKTII